MSTFQIVFTPTAAAELARMPKELQLQILGDFRGLPQQVLGTELEQFGKLVEQGGRTLHRFRVSDYRVYFERHELGVLSNFAPTPFIFHGKLYASLEGFWQMMKYPEGPEDPRAKFPGLEWKYTRNQVAQLSGFEANAAGALASQNMEKMGITWVSFESKHFEYKPATPGEHYKLIVEATWEKVKQNPEVKRVLVSTGDLILKPDHHQEPDAPAAWKYFEILMQIRSELQTSESRQPSSAQSFR